MRYLSLFSGMEAAHLAWAPLGWQCVGVAEIDSAACALLRHRLPDVPNLGDVSAVDDARVATLGRIDVVIGGSPCQDLSVAGKRAGLAGARSGLFHEQLRIFNAARTFCGARWLVWENVPGAFSSNAGGDFAVVVGAMAGCRVDVSADGWGNEGVALGEHGLVEWAVLDAQWFGVAQRRRRVFAVLDTGDWTGRSPVLLEPDRLRGDSAPGREAGEDAAGTITGGARCRGGYSNDDVSLIQDVAGTLAANPKAAGSATQQDAHAGLLIPEVAHTLRADGFDASEDGTGRGTPLIPVAYRVHGENSSAMTSDGDAAVAAKVEVARTIDTNGGYASHQGGNVVRQPVPFGTTQITSAANRSNPQAGDQCHPLAASAHPPAIAFAHQAGGIQTTLGYDPELGTAPTLSVCQTPAVHAGRHVRRLTPRECERLQGAPDDWTLVPNAQAKPMADAPRYKMLGNSFAVPVIRWIGQQLDRASGASKQQEAA